MHIATLQFSPVLGQVEQNIARADELLAAANTEGLDLLVLPELAFTGYNFPSLAAITPYLEPTASGPTAAWAIRTALRLRCTVCVGYPERAVRTPTLHPPTTTSPSPLPPGAVPPPLHPTTPNYNALLVAGPTGHTLANYGKTHLYYTDATWALPGAEGFQALNLGLTDARPSRDTSASSSRAPRPVPTALGICMDLNPHRFLAPWTAFEFAAHARAARCTLVVVSMAWLTGLARAELGWEPHGAGAGAGAQRLMDDAPRLAKGQEGPQRPAEDEPPPRSPRDAQPASPREEADNLNPTNNPNLHPQPNPDPQPPPPPGHRHARILGLAAAAPHSRASGGGGCGGRVREPVRDRAGRRRSGRRA